MSKWLQAFHEAASFSDPAPIVPTGANSPVSTLTAANGTNDTGGETAPEAAVSDPAGDCEERAAIIELDGRIPYEWAEGYARLCAMPCPTGVTPSEWESLVDACGRLLDRWGGRLSELGWTTADLFGMDARAPMARLNHAGLVRFLIGRDVVEVSADAVKLQTKNGGTQRLRRDRAGEPGQVPLWRLDGAL